MNAARHAIQKHCFLFVVQMNIMREVLCCCIVSQVLTDRLDRIHRILNELQLTMTLHC